MNLTRKHIKLLIETSPSVEKADEALTEATGFKTIPEKQAYLRGMFDIRFVAHPPNPSSESDYFIMLNIIIKGLAWEKKKWGITEINIFHKAPN